MHSPDGIDCLLMIAHFANWITKMLLIVLGWLQTLRLIFAARSKSPANNNVIIFCTHFPS
jgi:hypothetical protein